MTTATKRRAASFSFPRTAFAEAFGLVSRAVSGSPPMPILRSVLLRVEWDRVTMQATDLELAITHGFPVEGPTAQGAEPAVVLLPKGVVGDIIDVADGDDLQFRLGDASLDVTCASARWTLRTEDPDLFPEVRGFEASAWHEMPADELARAIRRTAHATGEDMRGFSFGGLAFEPQMLAFDVTALNGGVLASQKIAASPTAGTATFRNQPYLVPVRLVERLRAVLPHDDTPVQVAFPNDNWANFRWGDTTFCCKQLAGKFPDWRRWLPRDPIASFASPVKPLRLALARALTHLAEDTRRLEIGCYDQWDEYDSGLLNLGCKSHHGEAWAQADVQFQGDPERVENFGLNPRFLTGTLAGLGDDATPTVAFHDRNLISVRTEDGFTGVIMPYGKDD